MEQEKPDWYRPIYLFPGVEISVNGGVHILAIFDRSRTPQAILILYWELWVTEGTKGKSDAVTSEAPTDAVNLIAETWRHPHSRPYRQRERWVIHRNVQGNIT